MVGYEYIIGVAVIVLIACLPVYVSYSNYRIQRDKPMQELKESNILLSSEIRSLAEIFGEYKDLLAKHDEQLVEYGKYLTEHEVRLKFLEKKEKEN